MDDPFRANQRIILLQGLSRVAGYETNAGILQRLLRDYGHALGAEATVQLLNWLAIRGYLTVERLADRAVLAKLTQAGLDVALGNVIADGIDRPLVE